MKIIDLLNKIANGEVLPIRFKYRENEYFLNAVNDYWCVDTGGWFSVEELSTSNLNDEVKIIEEEKEIEKLEIKQNGNLNYYIENEFGTKCALTKHSKKKADKVNEIIDEINKLKRDKHE